MLSERMTEHPWPGVVNKYRDEQVAHISTWARVPDDETAMAACHSIRVVPAGNTTVTELNPMDPYDGWLIPPYKIPVTNHHATMRY